MEKMFTFERSEKSRVGFLDEMRVKEDERLSSGQNVTGNERQGAEAEEHAHRRNAHFPFFLVYFIKLYSYLRSKEGRNKEL